MTKRTEYGELEYRTPGDRRRDCLETITRVAVLEARVEANREASDRALVIAAQLVKEKMEELNELRKEYTNDREKDRKELIAKVEFDSFKESIERILKDIKRIVDNSVERLTSIESSKAVERQVTNKYIIIVGLILTAVNVAVNFYFRR